MGADRTDALAEQLYHTLYDYYLRLEDYVVIHPCHGAGSACGANIGDRLMSTIGYERRTNAFLQYPGLEEFRRFVVEEAPRVPALPAAQEGQRPRAGGDVAAPDDPGVTPRRVPQGDAPGGCHDHRHPVDDRLRRRPRAGRINIGDRAEMSVWVGQMFDPDQQLLLVVDNDTEVDEIQRLIVRTGHSVSPATWRGA